MEGGYVYQEWWSEVDPLSYEDWLSHTRPDLYQERRWLYGLYLFTVLPLGWALFWKVLGIADYLLWSAFLRGKVPLSHMYEVGWYPPIGVVLGLLLFGSLYMAFNATTWFVARVVFAWRIHRAR